MKRAKVYCHKVVAGYLTEESVKHYCFEYAKDYQGPGISLTMPTTQREYHFDSFPAFFDGLLPEGAQLEALLRVSKIDRYDYFQQLLTVGGDLIGAVTVEEDGA